MEPIAQEPTASDRRTSAGNPPGRPWVLSVLIALVLLLAGLSAYSNSFLGPLVFDDLDSITGNTTIRHLWPPWGALSPRVVGTAQGRPMLNLSLAVCYAVGGLEPWSYHVLNLAVHLLAGLALWGVVGRTMRLAGVRGYFGGAGRWLAAAVALLWMVHPLGTQSVTYVIQRAESMMGLFYLLTVYCAIRGLEEGRGRFWTVLSIVCCAFGMATKEVMASAPLMVMVFDRVFVFGSWRAAWRKRVVLYAGLVATWAPLAALVATSGGRSGTVVLGHPDISPLQYALTQCGFLLRYLRLSYWPDPLVFDYGQPDAGVTIVHRLGDGLPQALAIAVLLAGTGLALWRRPKWGFLGLWFWAILAPSSSFIPIVTEPAAEHRMYLPLAAVTAATVLGAFLLARHLLNRWPMNHGLLNLRPLNQEPLNHAPLNRPAASLQLHHTISIALAATSLLAATTALTWRTRLRNNDYHTAITLWSDTIHHWPANARAYNDLGNALDQIKEYDRALVEYNKSLAILPIKTATLNNRGLAYHHSKRLEEAIADFTRAVELDPNYADALANRGAVYGSMNRIDQAMEDLNRALSIQPDNSNALFNRGAAYFYLKQYDAALNDFNRSIELDGKRAECYRDRAVVYYLNRDYDKAWSDVRMCRKLDGAVPENFLAALMEESGRKE